MSAGRLEAARCLAIRDPAVRRAAETAAHQNLTGAQYVEFLDAYVEAEASNSSQFTVRSGADFLADESIPADPGESAIVEHVPNANRFEFSAASDYVNGPPMRWLIPGVIPQAELVVVYGASGSGKSFLTYDICAAITRGVPWVERETVKGKVAYIAAEGGHGMQNRIKAYAQSNGGFDDLPLMSRVAPNLMEAKDAADIANAMKRSGPYAAVVVDTLSRAHQGNENSGEDMGLVLKYCQLIHQNTGAVVILIHHTGKDESKGQRGWSGLRAAADAEIEITRDAAGNRAWSVAKMKDGSDEGIRGAFKLEVVPLGFDGESSCVVRHDTEAPKAPVKARKRPKGNALIVLQHMEANHRTDAPTMEELYDEIGEQVQCSRPGRRLEYFYNAVRQLADRETDKWLWRHPGDRVALSSVLPGGATDEPF